MLQLCLLAMYIPASRLNSFLFAATFGVGVEPQDDCALPVPGCHVTLACGAAEGVLLHLAVHALAVGYTSLQVFAAVIDMLMMALSCCFSGGTSTVLTTVLCYAGLLG